MLCRVGGVMLCCNETERGTLLRSQGTSRSTSSAIDGDSGEGHHGSGIKGSKASSMIGVGKEFWRAALVDVCSFLTTSQTGQTALSVWHLQEAAQQH